MTRRKHRSELNLDSLMDALTNVVGILVIVLVMTSLDVSSAVQRIKRDRPEEFGITADELLRTRRAAQKLRSSREGLQQQYETLATEVTADREQIASLRKRIDVLETGKSLEVERDELRKLLEQQRRKSREVEETLTGKQDELTQLQAKLDETPMSAAPPPKVVRLPNPRPAPKGLQPAIFICRQGKVLPFAPDPLQDRAEKRVEFLLRPLKAKAGPDGAVECGPLVEQFNETRIADDCFRVQLVMHNYNLSLEYQFQGGGESVERLETRNSKYQTALRRLDRRKSYVQFLVWPDSFDSYVAARRISDQNNLLAGWSALTPGYEWRTGLDIKVKCQGKPKPPPTPKKPPTTKPATSQPPPKPVPIDQID